MLAYISTPEWSGFWDALGVCATTLVAVSVIGESISHLIPKSYLPKSITEKILSDVAKYSTILLVVSLVLEIPIGIAKDRISAILIGRATKDSRVIENYDSATTLVDFMTSLGTNNYWMLIETNTYDPNEEQMRFGSQLVGILDAAGWKKWTNKMASQKYSRVSSRGLIIGYRDKDQLSATTAQKIKDKLSTFGISSVIEPFFDLDENAFMFDVGIR